MNHLANTKSVVSIMGTGVTAGATVTAAIDRLGYDVVAIDLVMGTSNTVSNNPTTLKLSESDITDATGYADITAFVGDDADGFTIANADTSVANVTRFNVDCRARKRYLKLTVSPLTTQAVVMVAHLGKSDDNADRSASAGGVLQVVSG